MHPNFIAFHAAAQHENGAAHVLFFGGAHRHYQGAFAPNSSEPKEIAMGTSDEAVSKSLWSQLIDTIQISVISPDRLSDTEITDLGMQAFHNAMMATASAIILGRACQSRLRTFQASKDPRKAFESWLKRVSLAREHAAAYMWLAAKFDASKGDVPKYSVNGDPDAWPVEDPRSTMQILKVLFGDEGGEK